MKIANFRKSLDLVEKVIAAFYFVYYSGAIFPLFITQGASEGDGVDLTSFNWGLYNLGFIFSYFIAVLFIASHWGRVLFIVKRGGIFLPLLTLMVPASKFWSISPSDTLSASIGLIGTTLFGLYVATRFSLKEQLELLGWAFGASMIIGVLLAVALPKYGIMGAVHAGTFRGVFTHKNILGKYMVLSLAVFLSLPKSSKLVWLGVLGSAVSIVLSTSTTSILNGLLVFFVFILIDKYLRLRPNLFAFFTSTGILLIWAVSSFWEEASTKVLEVAGKDPTFTGRAFIWAFSAGKIEERPLLGYGFNAFWGNPQIRSLVDAVFQWGVPDSHNGYLDFMLSLGILGFSLYVLSNLRLLSHAFTIARDDFTSISRWPFLLSTYIISINFMETTLISHNNILWLLFIIACFTIPVELHKVNCHKAARIKALGSGIAMKAARAQA